MRTDSKLSSVISAKVTPCGPSINPCPPRSQMVKGNVTGESEQQRVEIKETTHTHTNSYYITIYSHSVAVNIYQNGELLRLE